MFTALQGREDKHMPPRDNFSNDARPSTESGAHRWTADFLHEQLSQPPSDVANMQRVNDTIVIESDNRKILIAKDGFMLALDTSRKTAAETTKPHETDHIKLNVREGVSKKFVAKVENFADSIPPELRSLATKSGITFELVSTPEQIPSWLREGHARRHGELERSYGHLPSFYCAGRKSVIFIEHPHLTKYEAEANGKWNYSVDRLDHSGVRQLMDFNPQQRSFAPFERTAWHEFGHALDLAALGSYSLASEKFDAAYQTTIEKMSPFDKRYFAYFVKGDASAYRGHEFDAARQETFAELFALAHAPREQLAVAGGVRMQAVFASVLDAMRQEKPVLFTGITNPRR
jgi:hypothetical protein